ncbi:fido domain-containing protein [Chaetomium strumarium]|uniref:Fido domain-containing protein n=1 Tax=Chaetomium strumarium TaxID=1170767 RepID=A0AAJ0GV38_9PEZI|nr:fido domain-containing protein [Chaetomium strumarium]
MAAFNYLSVRTIFIHVSRHALATKKESDPMESTIETGRLSGNMKTVHRRSDSGLFPELRLEIGSGSSSPSGSPSSRPPSASSPMPQPIQQIGDLREDVFKTFSKGWPSWNGPDPREPKFTIRLAKQLREEAARQHFVEDPAKIIHTVRAGSQRSSSAKSAEAWESLEGALVQLVYSSNLIESAGNSLRVTINLCQAVFRGEAHVIRSRREIVQHAQALTFIIDHTVMNKEPWSEALILEAHRILYTSLDSDVEAGKYRTYKVAVKYEKPGQQRAKASQYMRAKVVPKYMKEMVENLNQDMQEAEKTGSIDPYTLAAHYHHQFVNIHPFGDGNGRMSRIILNAILLRYAGHVAEIGLDDNERDEYLRIATRASKVFHAENMEIDFHQHTRHFELAKFVLTKSKRNLERLWNWATSTNDGDEA